jgi:uncharacterized protein YdcH (DUF465 family)
LIFSPLFSLFFHPVQEQSMIESHDLYHEFPQYQETIRALMLSNDDFAKMMREYTEVDLKVARIEQRLDPASDLYAEELKQLRVRLKDRLYKMLVTSGNS